MFTAFYFYTQVSDSRLFFILSSATNMSRTVLSLLFPFRLQNYTILAKRPNILSLFLYSCTLFLQNCTFLCIFLQFKTSFLSLQSLLMQAGFVLWQHEKLCIDFLLLASFLIFERFHKAVVPGDVYVPITHEEERTLF